MRFGYFVIVSAVDVTNQKERGICLAARREKDARSGLTREKSVEKETDIKRNSGK